MNNWIKNHSYLFINNIYKNHTFVYDEPIKVESITQAICDLALRFGEGAQGEESIMVNINFIHYKFLE